MIGKEKKRKLTGSSVAISAEAECLRLKRELQAISECNQIMMHATDENKLLTDICGTICDYTGYLMAWVGIPEQNEAKTVTPIAWGGFEDGYLSTIDITWADVERGRGPTGMAARTGKTHFLQDFMTDPSAIPWRQNAMSRGYRSSIAIPLFDNYKKVFAVFSLYAGQPNGFTPAEIELLEKLAGDLSFGIGVLRERKTRQQAEENLKETSAYLNNLLDYANAPIIVWNSKFDITRFNHAFERLTGRKSSDVIGQKLDILFPSDSKAESLNHIIRASSGERWESIEIPILDTSGNIHIVLWNSATVLGTDGATATIAQGQEITDRVFAEEALRQSEARFRLSLKNSPVSIAAQDKNLKFLWAYNQRTVDALNVVGKSDSDLFFPEDAAQLIALKKKVLETGKDLHTKMWLTSNGKKVYIDLHMEPLTDTEGNITGILNATVDMTQMKQLEELIQIERDKLINILTSMEDGVCIVNDKYGIEYINPSMKAQCGDFNNQKCFEYFNNRNDVCPWCNNRDVIEYGLIQRKETTLPKTDKTYEVTDAPLQSPEGVTSKLIVFHDITEHKKIDQLKDEFISMVSHELKTPITIIMGSIYTALSEGVSKADAELLLKDAAISSESLANIVDNLLELSRAQANRLNIKKEQIEIKQIAANVLAKVKNLSSGHTLVLDLPDSLPRVPGDPIRIERILHNLTENAIKYSPRGGEIKIFAEVKDNDLIIGVQDHGVGISVIDQAKLFKPFERLEITRQIAGVGLGLNVCHRLVEAHNGKIWMISEPGKGSTFFFSLPL